MKLYITYIFFSLISLKSIGQNLVPNPSFEFYWQCPTNNGSFGVSNWTRVYASAGNSDYFNTCASLLFFSIPQNIYGTQTPYDGNAYCGSILYDEPYPESREYFQVQLTTPLVANHNYMVSFYVSLGEQCRFATSDIGLLITNNAITGNGTMQNLQYTPQITSGGIIDNMSGWTEISGIYSAIGGEKFITIGNFKNDAQTQLLMVEPVFGFGRAYYYFDNVSVTETNLGVENFSKNIEVNIHPNPCRKILNLDFENPESITEVLVISAVGQLIYKIKNNFEHIDLEELSCGIYYLVIKSDNSEIAKKIIKE